MNNKNIAIKVKNISKCYRIGMKENMHENLGSAIFDFIKSPLKNYRKYRSLYKFDDIKPGKGDNVDNNHSDIIWALGDVSFEVKRGEAIGIIGRNGAGKSTLLKILSRITTPSDGSIEIQGRVTSLLEVGTGFHQELTGRENVYLNGTILGMRKKEIDRNFDKIVDFSGVEKFIDTPVKRYSSGMKVRLAFSVAAHLELEILIIDEVLAVGDMEFQNKCLNKMQDVRREGRTVIFVSHNMIAITRLCNRAILIDNGRVIDDGPSDKIVAEYLNSGLDTTLVREWPDQTNAPGSEVVRLRSVRLLTENMETVDIREQIKIEMRFDVLNSGHVMLPHFGLCNDRGESAFITIDQDPAWRGRPRPKGKYVSTVIIPGNFLAEGRMFVGCYILTKNDNVLHVNEQNAISFLVVDYGEGNSARGDYHDKIPGVVRPLLKWSTQYYQF